MPPRQTFFLSLAVGLTRDHGHSRCQRFGAGPDPEPASGWASQSCDSPQVSCVCPGTSCRRQGLEGGHYVCLLSLFICQAVALILCTLWTVENARISRPHHLLRLVSSSCFIECEYSTGPILRVLNPPFWMAVRSTSPL